MRSHVPSSCQRLSRRQHVEGLGYSAGKSRQRAPDFNTHKMPSSTARLSVHRRPPRQLRGSFGNNGSIRFHCASDRRIPFLAISTSGQCRTPFQRQVQVWKIQFNQLRNQF
jgi:hypothetical protein